jgi:hypothetical protein
MNSHSFADEHEAFAARLVILSLAFLHFLSCFVLNYRCNGNLSFLNFSRVSQYVFVPTKEEVFTVLDQHADTLDGDVKLPLVLVGNEGKRKFESPFSSS